MDRLEAMESFVAVADCRSFTKAAQVRGVSRPSISRAVSTLEDVVGAQLLVRTTRTVSLSRVGERYLEDCRTILEAVRQSVDTARGDTSAPTGVIELTAPMLFGRLHVMPVVQSFLGEHPTVQANIQLLDRVTNLVEEGIDIAVRIGELPDSTQRATRVGRVTRFCVASPNYLAENAVLETPNDLANHTLAVHTTQARWRFNHGHHTTNPRIVVNNAQAVVELAQRGFGITQVLSYQVGEALADGSLVRVLADHEPDSVPVHLVTPARRHTSVRTQAFIAHAAEHLRKVAANGWRREQFGP